MNKFLAQKIKLANLDWTFYVTWINLLLMKHKLINFNWIVNNLIALNLLINYLNLGTQVNIWLTEEDISDLYIDLNLYNIRTIESQRIKADGFPCLPNCLLLKNMQMRIKYSWSYSSVSAHRELHLPLILWFYL